MIEVEVKYKLKNSKAVIAKLNSMAKRDKVNEIQKDTYYVLKSKLLRIRESRSGNFLSFKKKIDNISCNSLSTKIRDVKPIKEILLTMGFKQGVVVKKTRSTWLYKGCEIAIDQLKGFGPFIEIESPVKKKFRPIIKEIGAEVSANMSKGYFELLTDKC